MWACGNGFADGGEGPFGADLNRKSMIGIILEKGGNQVTCRGGGQSDVW